MTGFTVFLTGLSGAGKSTIADALRSALVREGRQVTLLDGDVVRTLLTAELGFSAHDRNLNIARVAFVAAEVNRHGGACICACIAPYEAARQAARRTVEEAGGRFVLVHVATPLNVCEARDPKGLYARARAGLLGQFTGVTDPYEAPGRADLVLDGERTPPVAAADSIIEHLVRLGCLPSAARDAGVRSRSRA